MLFHKKAVVLSVSAAALVLLYFVNPEQTGFMPRCLFHWLTGWDCPACGSQRAIHQLLHLRFHSAFTYNPFLIVSIPYLAALVLSRWFNDSGRWNKMKMFCHHPKVVQIYLVLLCGWWVVRNLI